MWLRGAASSERVTVSFDKKNDRTEVVVRHDRIPDLPTRERHRQGWEGCLDGLAAYAVSA